MGREGGGGATHEHRSATQCGSSRARKQNVPNNNCAAATSQPPWSRWDQSKAEPGKCEIISCSYLFRVRVANGVRLVQDDAAPLHP